LRALARSLACSRALGHPLGGIGHQRVGFDWLWCAPAASI